ncbi:MAG: CDP-archaeol synthase [Pirellulales bacterium]
MLRWRLLSAFIIVTAMLSLVAMDQRTSNPGIWLAPVLLTLSIMGTEEVLWLLKSQGNRPVAWPIYLGNFLLSLDGCRTIWMRWIPDSLSLLQVPIKSWIGKIDAPILLSICLMLVFVAEMRRYESPGRSILQVAFACFALTYVGLSLRMVALLRFVGEDAVHGLVALISVLVIVKMSDTGAYFFGRMLGRNKMTPILSPGKTWEGAVGGLTTACGAGLVYFWWIAPKMIGKTYEAPPVINLIAYCLALGVAGMIGDLAESLLKRDMRQKDSSSWLPGLGGILDIIDSVLLSAPIALLFWNPGPMHR